MIAASSVARDITERGRAERHRQMLMGELNHRVKNALATVQSIAAQTARTSSTLEAFQTAFMARLVALAKTHDLLTASAWQHAGLRELIVSEVAPYDDAAAPRVTLTGPGVMLAPKQVLALGLALHELATNAAKYGALSAPSGRVVVSWETEGTDPAHLRLLWTESGGPTVVAPTRRGFGTRVIQGGLAAELDGEIALSFAPGGVVCGIDIPLAQETAP
jgi:two-component sensor histidine kinase